MFYSVPSDIHCICSQLLMKMSLVFQCRRLDGGLSKLLAASEQLVELNEKLEIQKVAVTEKTEACEKLLEEITQKTNQANEKKELAVGKKSEIAEEKVKIAKEKVLV